MRDKTVASVLQLPPPWRVVLGGLVAGPLNPCALLLRDVGYNDGYSIPLLFGSAPATCGVLIGLIINSRMAPDDPHRVRISIASAAVLVTAFWTAGFYVMQLPQMFADTAPGLDSPVNLAVVLLLGAAFYFGAGATFGLPWAFLVAGVGYVPFRLIALKRGPATRPQASPGLPS